MRRYRLALLSTGILFVVALTSSFASRSALGLVVDGCRLNAGLTGSAFPCVKIVHEAGLLNSYAILREPTHRERTILTPLADVSGIEDKRLVAAGGPNYFADAWRERAVVLGAYPDKDPWLDAALAINAASNRSQDHLHIHMGCVSMPLKAALASHQADISPVKFQRISTRLAWRSFWVRFFPADDLSAVNPFQAVADGVPGARANMQDITIGVVGASGPGGRQGFYVLAEIFGRDHSYGSAEEVLDPKCRG